MIVTSGRNNGSLASDGNSKDGEDWRGTVLGGGINWSCKSLEGGGSKERTEAKITPLVLAELGESCI